MRRSYAPSNYDNDLCLKPPLLLWIAAVYLSRAIVLPLAWGMGSIAGISSDTIGLLHRLWSVDALVSSLVAAPVLYALCRRAPTASKPVRWLWSRGRIFMAAAAASDLVLTLIEAYRNWDVNGPSLPLLFPAIVDVYLLVYILASRRLKDSFEEFPPPLAIPSRQ